MLEAILEMGFCVSIVVMVMVMVILLMIVGVVVATGAYLEQTYGMPNVEEEVRKLKEYWVKFDEENRKDQPPSSNASRRKER